jgi:hypothetical protein
LNTASRIPPSRLISVCRGHVNDGGFPGSRCLPSCESAPGALAGACRFALPRLAGRRICRASSSLYKTATRPLLDRFRGRERGRTRSHDLCRWMSPRARLWDRSSIPGRGIRGAGRLPSGRKLPSDRGSRRRCSRSGVEQPMLDIHGRDCSRPRLRPNPDRSGHLSSRDTIPRRSGATRWEKWCCQRRARLQGAPADRAVERGISAKMPGAHRPEVPSVTRTFANERSHAREPKLTDSGAGAFFTTGQRARGTPAHARPWPGEIG